MTTEQTVQVEFTDDQVVHRVRLTAGRTTELNLELVQLIVLMQVFRAEAALLPPIPELPQQFPPEMAHSRSSDLAERALRLAERILEQREPPPEAARGDRKDVVVKTSGTRVSGLEINPAWARRVNPVDFAARLAQRLREAQQAARRDPSGDLGNEVAALAAELTNRMQER